jgi:phosphate-selective porin
MANAVSSCLLIFVVLISLIVAVSPVNAQTGGTKPAPEQSFERFQFSGNLWTDARTLTRQNKADGVHPVSIARARLEAVGDLSRRVTWAASVELSRRSFLRNAYVNVRMSDHFMIRVGQFTPNIGLERVTSLMALETVGRSRLTSQLTYTQNVGVSALSAAPIKGWLSYNLAVVTGTGYNNLDNNAAKDTLGRLLITPPVLPGLTLVVSGANGDQPDGNRTRAGVGVQYSRPSFRIAAETLQERHVGRPGRGGYYLTGVYRIRPATATRLFHMTELYARYLRFDQPAATKEWDTGISHYVHPKLRFTVNFIVPVNGVPQDEVSMVARTQVLF